MDDAAYINEISQIYEYTQQRHQRRSFKAFYDGAVGQNGTGEIQSLDQFVVVDGAVCVCVCLCRVFVALETQRSR
jgi:hypothetical protein